jgi:hypothetical protein
VLDKNTILHQTVPDYQHIKSLSAGWQDNFDVMLSLQDGLCLEITADIGNNSESYKKKGKIFSEKVCLFARICLSLQSVYTLWCYIGYITKESKYEKVFNNGRSRHDDYSERGWSW